MKKIIAFTAILLCAVPLSASAHEPNYIGSQSSITIPDPETSRAYYGALSGTPARFTIRVATGTDFYLNILSPDIPGARTDFTAIMSDISNNPVIELKGDAAWQPWYEEFAGDMYLKGPEIKKTLPAGEYTITVSNPGNQGKYVLAPGEAEVFTIQGTPSMIRQIYLMKTLFFGKSPFSLFEGVIGHILLALLAIVLCAAAFSLYLLRRRRR
jgi:hypothetical protein